MGEFFEMQQEGLLDEVGEYIGPIPDFYKELKYKCHKCKRGFASEQALKQHNRDKHEKTEDE